MGTSWSTQDRKDLRRSLEDLEVCRKKISELRAAKNKAVKGLKGLSDTIQYQTSFSNPAYAECCALISELEGVE